MGVSEQSLAGFWALNDFSPFKGTENRSRAPCHKQIVNQLSYATLKESPLIGCRKVT